MEKTLILKHISGILCLLISYSKFTRSHSKNSLIYATASVKVNSEKGVACRLESVHFFVRTVIQEITRKVME